MKEVTRKQPAKKSETSRQLWGVPEKSQPERTAGEELPGADLNVGRDILDIMDALPFYVLLVDAHHYILQANRAVRKHLGLEPQDIVGKYCPKVIHGLDEPFYACPLEEAVEKDQPVEIEAFDPESGRWVNSAIYPTQGLTQDGKRIYFHMVTDITNRKQNEERLRASRKQLRSLLAHLESVKEEERKKMARELHDETSQVLASLTASLEAAAGMLPASADKTKAILRKAQALSIHISDDINKLIYELRPTLLDDLGLVAATRWLADNILGATGVTVNFKTAGQVRRLAPQLETTLFRVTQEALYNIARHAQAKNASISLHFKKSVIEVHVRDDGKGFDVEEAISSKDRPRGFGLLGMKERVESMNGTFSIRSRPGSSGTEINVKIPLNYEASSE